VMQIFKPLKGCVIAASKYHHTMRCGERVGKVVEVNGNIVFFKDANGDTDCIIWNKNKTIILGV